MNSNLFHLEDFKQNALCLLQVAHKTSELLFLSFRTALKLHRSFEDSIPQIFTIQVGHFYFQKKIDYLCNNRITIALKGAFG